ncbi:NifB/NifX family molybdenum-iron cluster-binding protein [Motiliproteus sp. SC1-56]|uniref:NifB/NifX family molybdenum-iron cluster-binding protein n=1 Tax=Motiliproteus sp. SC1-56 TaxID=2799565 RepID=UPI001A909ABB|nr:NifB/NifX family molybdenum-iron cluster-binding protein [Motiliproteus sp. SC1-56]
MPDTPFRFKIAVATNDGQTIDGHFGTCESFAIYQFDADSLERLESRPAATVEGIEKNAARAAQLDDCHLLYVASIGGPAAAKVIKHGIHPLRDQNGSPITATLERLQAVLKGSPPPWMAKLMGREPARSLKAVSGGDA